MAYLLLISVFWYAKQPAISGRLRKRQRKGARPYSQALLAISLTTASANALTQNYDLNMHASAGTSEQQNPTHHPIFATWRDQPEHSCAGVAFLMVASI